MRSAALWLGLAFAAALPLPARAQQASALPAEPETFFAALGDPVLAQLVEQGLRANRDLRAAEARVRGARASRTHAALDLAPAVTASAGYNRQRLSSAALPGVPGRLPDQDIWDAGVQLSWEVDVFGRLRNALQGRNALLAAAEDDVRDVHVILAAELAAAYFELRGAQDRLEVARRNAANQQRTLEITRDRLEAGHGNALDTERAQAQLSSTLAAVPALEAEIAATQHRIAVLLGRQPGQTAAELDGATAPLRLPEALQVTGADVVVRMRPDVRSAANQHAARRAFASAARADYLPRLSLGGTAGYTASELDALGNRGTPRYVVGPVISWPLLDMGRVHMAVDAARAEQSEAAARYEQAVLRAQEEVATSLSGYHKSRERLAHLEAAAAASERATDLARLRYEEGGTDFLEVLDAERRLLETQDQLSAGRTRTYGWLVAAYRATAGRLPLQSQ